jgi:hypothetical protein
MHTYIDTYIDTKMHRYIDTYMDFICTYTHNDIYATLNLQPGTPQISENVAVPNLSFWIMGFDASIFDLFTPKSVGIGAF